MLGRASFIAGGLTLVHVLPLLLGFMEPTRAMWGWTAGPPLCNPKFGWTFSDGSNTLAPGSSIVMTCTVTGTNETVECP
eukprot:CAMPEP_0114677606 /NCGR_PEP_ID=MMETSP0191-20121206/50724_1 /TAXON_ID=126664 /ORGANISM="Sorites sp." /LENGTH=78 /DNA_ID=CAMNT_0001950413 /DNA_START=59 /DNA_END=292 /DNA_ORIENTATION=-